MQAARANTVRYSTALDPGLTQLVEVNMTMLQLGKP